MVARVAHHFIVQPFAAQLLHQPRRAKATGLAVNDGIHHPLHADEAALFQLVENGLQVITLFHIRRQLALQLQPRMLALPQQLQGSAFE
ncbi:hypothetical protein SDC9_210809 [bioreactor metagenome]|uniref:Uncharacterized protein n=1 Tax=bioreactor metagenome TaxID=1076179 RepID=A0A645JH86_9ZZZZ